MQTVTFDYALDVLESLPLEQQETLFELWQKRRLEAQREAFVEGVEEAERDYAAGRFIRGSAAEIMKALKQ
jgi:hypothetical protein